MIMEHFRQTQILANTGWRLTCWSQKNNWKINRRNFHFKVPQFNTHFLRCFLVVHSKHFSASLECDDHYFSSISWTCTLPWPHWKAWAVQGLSELCALAERVCRLRELDYHVAVLIRIGWYTMVYHGIPLSHLGMVCWPYGFCTI